jgi:Glucodextranase, domain B/PASTA domain
VLRRTVSLILLSLAATAAGCGADAKPAAPRPPVQLTFSEPQDTGATRDASVQVSGSVAPASARVLVMGERVAVSGGRFSTTVALREGANVIDVGASAPAHQAIWRALRVTRHSMIAVPDLLGHEADEASTAIEDLGLKVHVDVDDDLLDAFRSRPRIVCSMDPEPETQVQPGDEVDLVVSKTC